MTLRLTKCALVCMAAIVARGEENLGPKSDAASIGGQDDKTGPRAVIKQMEDLFRFVENGEQQSAVVGFFKVDEENGIIGRDDTK